MTRTNAPLTQEQESLGAPSRWTFGSLYFPYRCHAKFIALHLNSSTTVNLSNSVYLSTKS
jgi:hypothetical protein